MYRTQFNRIMHKYLTKEFSNYKYMSDDKTFALFAVEDNHTCYFGGSTKIDATHLHIYNMSAMGLTQPMFRSMHKCLVGFGRTLAKGKNKKFGGIEFVCDIDNIPIYSQFGYKLQANEKTINHFWKHNPRIPLKSM